MDAAKRVNAALSNRFWLSVSAIADKTQLHTHTCREALKSMCAHDLAESRSSLYRKNKRFYRSRQLGLFSTNRGGGSVFIVLSRFLLTVFSGEVRSRTDKELAAGGLRPTREGQA